MNSLTSNQALARRKWNHQGTRHSLKFQVQPNYCRGKADFSLLLTHFSPSSSTSDCSAAFSLRVLLLDANKSQASTPWAGLTACGGTEKGAEQPPAPPLAGQTRAESRREFPAPGTKNKEELSLQHRESSVSSSPQTPQKSIPQEWGSPLQGNRACSTPGKDKESQIVCCACSTPPKNIFNIHKLPPV